MAFKTKKNYLTDIIIIMHPNLLIKLQKACSFYEEMLFLDCVHNVTLLPFNISSVSQGEAIGLVFFKANMLFFQLELSGFDY